MNDTNAQPQVTAADIDLGLRQQHTKALADYYDAKQKMEAAEKRLHQLNFAISIIEAREKTRVPQ